jgi:hypothetical protein
MGTGTGTAATTARDIGLPVVQYVSKAITYLDRGTEVTIGTIPAGSYIIGGGFHVTTAFTGTGTDLVDIGTDDDPDGFATDLDVSSKGYKVFDELATSDDLYCAADTVVTVSYADANTDAGAGAGVAIVQYITRNG